MGKMSKNEANAAIIQMGLLSNALRKDIEKMIRDEFGGEIPNISTPYSKHIRVINCGGEVFCDDLYPGVGNEDGRIGFTNLLGMPVESLLMIYCDILKRIEKKKGGL